MTVDFVEMSPRQILELNWKSFKLALKYALDGYKHNEVLKGVEAPGKKRKVLFLSINLKTFPEWELSDE